MSGFIAAVDGYKSYIILVAIAILLAVTEGDTNGLDLNQLMTDPELLLKELFVALAAAGRSAISKIGTSG